MNILDIRTVLISYGISNAVCVAVMGIMWRQIRNRYPELSYWLAGYILQSAGMLLIVLRGQIPNILSIVAANAMLIAGTYLQYLGLDRYFGKKSSQLVNSLLLAAFLFFQVYFTYAQPSLVGREINVSAALLLLCSQSAWIMLRPVDKKLRSAAQRLAWVFSGYCLINLANIILYLAVPAGDDFLKSGLYSTLVILADQILFVGLTFAFFLLVNRRLFIVLENELQVRERTEQELLASQSELQVLLAAMPDAILLLDQDGRYLKIATNDPRLLIRPADDLVGKNLHEVFPRQDADRFLHQIQVCLETGQPVRLEYSLQIQGQTVWFSASVSPMTGHSVIWVARDITERKQAEALQQAVYRIATATETARSMDELYPKIHQIIASVMPAENFYIMLYDDPSKTLQFPYDTDSIDKSYTEEILGGKGISRYVLRTGESLLCTREVHAELERQGEVEFVGVPSAIWLGVPLLIEGTPIGVMVVQHYTDPNAYTEREQHMLEFVSSQVAIAITRKQAEKKLEKSEAELRALFSAMTDVVIVYDREGRYRNVAPTDTHLLIGPAAQLIGKSMKDVFPDADAGRFLGYIENVLTTGGKVETEYSIRSGEGKSWFACTISPFQVDSVLWVAHNITKRKNAEKLQEVVYALARAAISSISIDEFYRSMHTSLAELIHVENFYIALYDPASDMISFPYYVDQYDEPPPDAKPSRGLTEYVMRSGKVLLAPRPVFDQLIQAGEVETIGTPPIDWLGAPLKVADQIIGVMATQSYQDSIHFNQEDMRLFEFVSTQVAQMIDRKRIDEKARYLGIHDGLTGLYNRAYFDEEMKRLERGRQFPVSVLMADLDHLKETNDMEGHAAGDELLRRTAQVLKSAFRVEDVVARIGGDEFAVLLPGIDAGEAKSASRRIQEIIATQNTGLKSGILRISMGVSTLEMGGSLEQTLKMADEQMYVEKQKRS